VGPPVPTGAAPHNPPPPPPARKKNPRRKIRACLRLRFLPGGETQNTGRGDTPPPTTHKIKIRRRGPPHGGTFSCPNFPLSPGMGGGEGGGGGGGGGHGKGRRAPLFCPPFSGKLVMGGQGVKGPGGPPRNTMCPILRGRFKNPGAGGETKNIFGAVRWGRRGGLPSGPRGKSPAKAGKRGRVSGPAGGDHFGTGPVLYVVPHQDGRVKIYIFSMDNLCPDNKAGPTRPDSEREGCRVLY